MKRQTQNPYELDDSEIKSISPQAYQKARVIDVKDRQEGNVHFATVKLYQSGGQETLPVLTPAYGDVALPKENTDVMVIFGESGAPIIIGHWYSADRLLKNEINVPDFEAGDRIVGNGTGSMFKVAADGSIRITTDGQQPVDIDHQSGTAFLSSDQSVPDSGAYEQLQFDTTDTNNDPEALFDPSQNALVVRDSGTHVVSCSVEIPDPKQGNAYTLGIFRNGSEWKRATQQSTNNQPLSVQVDTQKYLNSDDVLTAHLEQDSGGNRTVTSDRAATEFNIRRNGI